MNFSIMPLETEPVDRARALLKEVDPSVEVVVADAPHAFPCRHCLMDAAPGERMLLFSHSPFDRPGPYREVGPIFAHERRCERASQPAVPDQLRRRLLALRGYSATQKLIAADVVQGSDLEPLLSMLFERSDVAYVHARFAKAGCFACRIDRA